MSVSFRIGTKYYDVHVSAGWYRGEDWKLLTIELFNMVESMPIIFQISILKFCFSIYGTKGE